MFKILLSEEMQLKLQWKITVHILVVSKMKIPYLVLFRGHEGFGILTASKHAVDDTGANMKSRIVEHLLRSSFLSLML